jgi:hypothetical protein
MFFLSGFSLRGDSIDYLIIATGNLSIFWLMFRLYDLVDLNLFLKIVRFISSIVLTCVFLIGLMSLLLCCLLKFQINPVHVTEIQSHENGQYEIRSYKDVRGDYHALYKTFMSLPFEAKLKEITIPSDLFYSNENIKARIIENDRVMFIEFLNKDGEVYTALVK